MLDNRFSFADEQLFAELTPEEGAAISGGATYMLKNDTASKQYCYTYDAFFELKLREIAPGQQISFNSSLEKAHVLFDNDATNNLKPDTREIVPGGTYRFTQAADSQTIDLVQGLMSVSAPKS